MSARTPRPADPAVPRAGDSATPPTAASAAPRAGDPPAPSAPEPAGAAADEVFVSYAHEDRGRVEELVRALARRGLGVFWDREIPPGHRWEDVLDRRLAAARCVVVAWSEAARRSDWVAIEAARARAQGTLVPVSLDGAAPPLEFSRIQVTDLAAWRADEEDAAFDLVVGEIRRHVRGEADAADAGAAAARAPWGAVASVAAGIAALAAVAAGIALRQRPIAGAALPLVLLAAAAAGGIAARGAALGAARLLRRTLRRATAPLAAAVGALAAAAGAYALAHADVRFVATFRGPDGACPAGLGAATGVTVAVDGFALRAAIDARCRAAFLVPGRVLGRDAATLRLDRQDRWLLADPRAVHRVSRAGVDVALVPAERTPRTDLVMFEYEGTAESRERLAELRGALSEAIVNLQQRLTPAGPEAARYAHLGRVRVDRVGEVFAGGADDLLRRWSDAHALGLLWGTISAAAGHPTRTNVFIGGEDRAAEVITLETRIAPEQFQRIRATHAIAILYALARDARRLRAPPDVVAAYLGEAASLAQDVVDGDPADASARALQERVLAAAREHDEASP